MEIKSVQFFLKNLQSAGSYGTDVGRNFAQLSQLTC